MQCVMQCVCVTGGLDRLDGMGEDAQKGTTSDIFKSVMPGTLVCVNEGTTSQPFRYLTV